MMDITMQKPDAIHLNLSLWELIAEVDTLILCEDSEPVVMLRNITSMNSELRLIAHGLVSNGVPSQHMVLSGSDQAAEIDKSLDRERKARRSLAQCFARHRSLWNRMQLKIDQAREDYPLLDLDGLENYFENMMETEVFSPESPDAPSSKTDLQGFGAAVYNCGIQYCAQMLMKLDDYLRPFGEDLSDSPQPLALEWSEIIIELDDLHIDVQQLYK